MASKQKTTWQDTVSDWLVSIIVAVALAFCMWRWRWRSASGLLL